MGIVKLRIRSNPDSVVLSTIELDGVAVPGVHALTLRGVAGDIWVATMEVFVRPDIEVDAEVETLDFVPEVVDVTTCDDDSRKFALRKPA